MIKWFLSLLVVAMFVSGSDAMAGDPSHRIGAGVHYWVTLDDVDVEDVEEDGFAYLLTYQYNAGTLLSFELDLEIFPEELTGTDDNLYAPQAFILLGSTIYAGFGAGYYYYDGDFSDDPFFTLRAGLNIELLPKIHLDANVNYHLSDISDFDDIDDDIDTDTLTLGAAIRIEL